MFFPYSTDAPIYHWPVMIVILIVVNTILLPFSGPLSESGFALELGNGLHPLQWVTTNFLHGGLLHLAGNMLFLWAYGIIVEGKLGWWRTLLVYLAIGTLYGATVQVLCLGMEVDPEEGPHLVLGASAAIFGLLGLCMVWAPVNCISVVYFFGFFLRGLWEAPIWIFAIVQVLLESLEMLISGVTGAGVLGSAMLHVTGFSWGFLLGVVLFKMDLVDCEGWDLFVVLSKKYIRGDGTVERAKTPRYLKDRPKKKASKASTKSETTLAAVAPEDRASSAMERIRKRLDADEARAAVDLYQKSSPSWKQWGWGMPEADLMRLIKAAHAAKLEVESMPMMFEYARRFPDRADRVRLKLAQFLMDKQDRPARAMRLLEEISPNGLPADLERARLKLVAKAQAMIDDGVLELEADD